MKKLLVPVLILLLVTAAGSLFVCYSMASKVKAQTGGGIMGVYRMKFLERNGEAYVVVDTQFLNGQSTTIFSDSLLYSWGIKDYTYVWHYNTKDKKWEDALAGKSGK